ncbi:MAG: hypothetical protein HY882_02670 [Deltaproteobacteria bacterium]|nr:hypothetical protein [Deltaproteobacteria bacterium]
MLASAGLIGGKPKTAKNYRFLTHPLLFHGSFSREDRLAEWENLIHLVTRKVHR